MNDSWVLIAVFALGMVEGLMVVGLWLWLKVR